MIKEKKQVTKILEKKVKNKKNIGKKLKFFETDRFTLTH